jgi:hypothetical protein
MLSPSSTISLALGDPEVASTCGGKEGKRRRWRQGWRKASRAQQEGV